MTRRRFTWPQYQRYRFQGLMAEGLSADPAYMIAQFERMYRERLSRIIGNELARKAQLHYFFDDEDGMRVFLSGSLDTLTDAKIDKLKSIRPKHRK